MGTQTKPTRRVVGIEVHRLPESDAGAVACPPQIEQQIEIESQNRTKVGQTVYVRVSRDQLVAVAVDGTMLGRIESGDELERQCLQTGYVGTVQDVRGSVADVLFVR